MSCCADSSEEVELKKINDKIEKDLINEKKSKKREVKILLLGPGESGKSTIFRQMRIIHMNGFTADEFKGMRDAVYGNVHYCMYAICKAMETLEIPFENSDLIEDSQKILELDYKTWDYDKFSKLVISSKKLLADAGVQKAIERSSEYYLYDNAPYFFLHLDRFSSPDYIPSQQDILMVRVKTTGISEIKFKLGSLPIHMFDVGGQRSERRKWIHCFENVTSMIFCVSLSCYDQQLAEDRKQNRMLETLLLFDSVINTQWFAKTSIILFLNMVDLFKQKLPKKPLADFFPLYKGGSEFEEGVDFIYQQFANLNKAKLPLYSHITCATDTENIKFVFAAVQETVLQNYLKVAGIM